MAVDVTTVRLAGGAQGFNWLPVFVAEELGLFADQGLTIEFQRLGSVDKATAAVREGSADLAITPPEGAVADFVAGGFLRLVAGNSVRLPMSMVARPDIQDLSDLRGKRIGTSSLTEGTALYVQTVLARAGLTYPGDYEFVLAGVHTTRWKALQDGEIDCAPQPAPWNFLAEQQGYRLIGEVDDALPEVVFAAVVADGRWAEQHRELVDPLVAALSRAHEFVNDPNNDPVTLPIYQRITTPDSGELAERGLSYTRDKGMWPAGLQISDDALASTVDLMVRAGLLAEEDRVTAIGAYDPSFLIDG